VQKSHPCKRSATPQKLVGTDQALGAVLRPLHPLILYDRDAGKIFFLNTRRGEKQAQYLCYTTGKIVKREALANDQCAFVADILNSSSRGA
jgi:hypothetical protein